VARWDVSGLSSFGVAPYNAQAHTTLRRLARFLPHLLPPAPPLRHSSDVACALVPRALWRRWPPAGTGAWATVFAHAHQHQLFSLRRRRPLNFTLAAILYCHHWRCCSGYAFS